MANSKHITIKGKRYSYTLDYEGFPVFWTDEDSEEDMSEEQYHAIEQAILHTLISQPQPMPAYP